LPQGITLKQAMTTDQNFSFKASSDKPQGITLKQAMTTDRSLGHSPHKHGRRASR